MPRRVAAPARAARQRTGCACINVPDYLIVVS